MEGACTSGLVWRIISRAVTQEFPQLAHLIHAAQNASGQLARGEHEVQINYLGVIVLPMYHFSLCDAI